MKRRLITVIATRFTLLAALTLTGCVSNLPRPVSNTIYQVGNHTPDAGIIRRMYTKDGTFAGWLVRQWAVDDYAARLGLVGAKLIPPVKPGAGVSDYGSYHLMTAEAYDRWASLCRGDLP